MLTPQKFATLKSKFHYLTFTVRICQTEGILCLEEEGSGVVHRVGSQGARVEEGKVGVGRGHHHVAYEVA